MRSALDFRYGEPLAALMLRSARSQSAVTKNKPEYAHISKHAGCHILRDGRYTSFAFAASQACRALLGMRRKKGHMNPGSIFSACC